jgi:hypothetical protein
MSMRVGILLAVLGLLSACSAHPKRVDCETHLQPINAPAPPSSTGDYP